ncbi:MAG: hypoxanthine phosphoribosyltransferase [Kiritimatiellae bacterium]|nr:hypoxanthine phosphoribosyltransferase [Kiritimatiellia bacterium]
MVQKEYIDPNKLLRDSFLLARKIYDSGYRPTVILVLWRGGTPIGIVVHEFLAYKGLETYHTVIKAESYKGIEQRIEPHIENLDCIVNQIPKDAHVLIVDDIFDSGQTTQAVRDALAEKTKEVRIATLYVRKGHHTSALKPDFYIREFDHWLVFPHELSGLSPEEIANKQPAIGDIVL